MEKINGLIPVLITPIDRDGNVDYHGLKNLLEYHNTEGIEALWVLGTGGEDMSLTMGQRLSVTEFVANNKNNLKIIVGCSFYSEYDTYEFLDGTAHMNIDAYHAMPYHPKISLVGIYNWYERIADYAKKPIWAYTSGNWAQHMPAEFISGVAKIKNIHGVKYSSSNLVEIQEASWIENEEFQVITAVVKTLLPCLQLGIKAATTVEAALFQSHILDIFSHVKNNEINEARVKQRILNTELLKYPNTAANTNFLRTAEIRYLLSKKIKISTDVPLPYEQLSQEGKDRLDAYYASNQNGMF